MTMKQDVEALKSRLAKLEGALHGTPEQPTIEEWNNHRAEHRALEKEETRDRIKRERASFVRKRLAELEDLIPRLEAERDELQMEAMRDDIEKIAPKLDG